MDAVTSARRNNVVSTSAVMLAPRVGSSDVGEEVKSWDRRNTVCVMHGSSVSAIPTPLPQPQLQVTNMDALPADGFSATTTHDQDRELFGSLSEKSVDNKKPSLAVKRKSMGDTTIQKYNQPRVLVVDDAASNRKMLCRLLRSRCRAVDEAADGQEALNMLLKSLTAPCDLQYDIVLMDFVMPVMDGPTATSEIRKAGYTGFVFGLTGNVLLSDIEFFKAHGANYVLTKPFDVKQYDGIIAKLR